MENENKKVKGTPETMERIRGFRKEFNGMIEKIDKLDSHEPAFNDNEVERCRSIARVKTEEARMWLGKLLGALGSELPKEFRDK